MNRLPSWFFGRRNGATSGESLFHTLHQASANGSCLFLFYVEVRKPGSAPDHPIDRQTMDVVERILSDVAPSLFQPKARVLSLERLWGNDFAIYAAFPNGVREDEVRLFALLLQERLVVQFLHRGIRNQGGTILIRTGFSELSGDDLVKERYASLKNAAFMAKHGLSSREYVQLAQFHRILNEEAINTLFMPIASLTNGHPLGWEALARGPENTPFFSPAVLFSFAEETDRLFQLEEICRKRALEAVRYLQPEQKLFINLDPRAAEKPFFLRDDVAAMLAKYGLAPQNVVLEITERHAITNYAAFRKILEAYRKKGFLIAVDDAGAGYSSLESITEIYPDYIKLDMSLIRGIHMDSVKRALVETIVQFADKVKCLVVAEGIETERELQTLIELGVPYGQGFYLGKPTSGLALITGEAMNFISRLQRKHPHRINRDSSCICAVGDISTRTVTVDKHAKVRHIHQQFEQFQRMDCVVVLDQQKPIGLIMRHQMYQVLSSRYGMALYYDRPVSLIMNANPLTVSLEDPLDEVAKRAMARNARHIYDVVVVVDESGNYAGVVTVQTLLDHLATMKVESAAFANPLTGLPGNVRIKRELTRRLCQGEEFVVIYCDLDQFKWFNDQYGFERGDLIIRRTAYLLMESLANEGGDEDFLGHIGGDDFILMTQPERVEGVVTYIRQVMHDHFRDLYKKDDRRECIPRLSMSMAGVYVSPHRYASAEEVSGRAAMVKKHAKRIPGTVFVCDFHSGAATATFDDAP